MDEDTMPAVAGIVGRCVDPTKGCYTGQEVVVRIRDRGHVNRHLRGVLLDEQSPPELGTSLFLPGNDPVVGTIRSLVRSPRFDRMIALAVVRREIQPPASLSIGSPRGPRGEVRALSDAGWVLVEGDLSLYP
jgi:folate-binding protein YgfZ